MYSNAPDLSSARQLFDEMPEKDSASYNAIISIYSKFGMGRLSLSLFQKMVRDGVCSDEFMFVTILNDFVKIGQIFGGMQLHSLIVKGRFCSDHFTCNALLSLYSKCGFVGSAAKLLDEIGGRDVVSWTSMIAGLTASGRERDAFEAFGWMRMSEVVPNTFTFGSLVGSCASTSSLEMGKQFHALVLKYGLEGGVVVGSAMVDMYSKSGEMDNTMRIFRSLRENGEEKCVKLQEEVRQLEDEKITWMQKEELTGLKRDNAYSNMPFDDFLELVLSISELHHPNIVELVGYCSEFQQCLLVYNYIRKRTLHDILHSSNILKRKLSWNTRIQVAIGAARALEYLHEGCTPPIVHPNFEPANVLLDDELS